MKATIETYTTADERKYAKKAGRFYLKQLRNMGLLFLLALILTGASVATSSPAGNDYYLEAGQSVTMAPFWGEMGDSFQMSFFIIEANGTQYEYLMDKDHNQTESNETVEAYHNDEPWEEEWDPEDWENQEYNYDNGHDRMEGPFDLLVYMQDMPGYLLAELHFSESYDFSKSEVLIAWQGDIMVSEKKLPRTGYYQLEMTNLLDNTDFLIGAGHAQASIGLVISAIVTWTIFGLAVAFFGFSVHIGWWILVIYVLIKAFKLIQEEDERKIDATVIGPSEEYYNAAGPAQEE